MKKQKLSPGSTLGNFCPMTASTTLASVAFSLHEQLTGLLTKFLLCAIQDDVDAFFYFEEIQCPRSLKYFLFQRAQTAIRRKIADKELITGMNSQSQRVACVADGHAIAVNCSTAVARLEPKTLLVQDTHTWLTFQLTFSLGIPMIPAKDAGLVTKCRISKLSARSDSRVTGAALQLRPC